MNLADAIKYVEDKLPGYVDHEIEATQNVVSNRYAEFAAVTAKLSSLETVSEKYRTQLDTIKDDIAEAEAAVAKLTKPSEPPLPTPQPSAVAVKPTPGQPIQQ